MVSLLLAGGKSSRMGKDKALIEIDGEACISRVVNALNNAEMGPIIISISNVDLIKPYKKLLAPNIDIIWSVDENKFAGPIESIMQNILKFCKKGDFLQLATVDTPWVTEDFFKRMRNSIQDNDDLVMPADGKNLHPLLSYVKSNIILRKLILGSMEPLRIQFSDLSHSLFIEKEYILKNINYPQDLE